jgi:hypothetical protein
VGNLLRRGIDDPNYDPIPELLQTNWYRTTQASMRQWEALRHNDPASAGAREREETARVYDMILSMGLRPEEIDTSENCQRRIYSIGCGSSGIADEVNVHPAAKAQAAGCLIWAQRDEPYPVGYYCGVQDPAGHYIEFSYGQPLGPGAKPINES